MFNELYKKSMDNVKPDELLVQKTKNLMHKELKKKPKNFYKYAAVAACLIITFSLVKVNFEIASVSDNTAPSIGSLNSDIIIEESNISNLDFSNAMYFANIEAASPASEEGGLFQKIVGFIESIIDWMKGLF